MPSSTAPSSTRAAYDLVADDYAQLHDPADLVARLEAAGFIVDEDLQRAPREHESGPQGFLRVHRS
ncbi:hypothetical protein ACTXI0_11810 [Arthrobacter rhombi]|uniref:Uncharacterized protein n=1 Tax=Arthrobacter rhombi TaxID=71253 RepID=A0A1R4FIF1_9MICC|nr:hypothetical protein [Arthrobacter rhombi]SJM55633.1 hypothetical protein FM101_04070 [Arthrobacter rhombi]